LELVVGDIANNNHNFSNRITQNNHKTKGSITAIKTQTMFRRRKKDYTSIDSYNPTGATVQATPTRKELSQEDLIRMLHGEIQSAQDKLVSVAKGTFEISIDKDLENKAIRLKKLGFKNAEAVLRLSTETEKATEHNSNVNYLRSIADNAQHYRIKYPMYRYITRSKLDEVCKKYGLYWGSLDDYTGNVPDYALSAIENSGIHDDDIDRVFFYSKDLISRRNRELLYQVEGHFVQPTIGQITRNVELIRKPHHLLESDDFRLYTSAFQRIIAAPKGQMVENLFCLGAEVEKPQYVINDDPIVLRPNYRNNVEGFLIEAAWGPESMDEEIFNPIYN
jgi:hypothetical protein